MLQVRTILHPTDFSEGSKYALHLAGSLVRAHDAGLTILHVAPPPVTVYGGPVGEGAAVEQVPPEAYENLRDELRHLQPPGPGVRVEHRLEKGDAATEILRVAQETDCDLIVMGTHGRTGLDRLLMGSVAEEVVRKASCPVVTVKTALPRAEASFRTVLHPTDFSGRSEYAFRLACALAVDPGAHLVILHVVAPPIAHGEVVARRQPDYYEPLWNNLHGLQAPDSKIRVEHRLEEGDAAAEILRTAQEVNADLIVLGTHGRTGLVRLLMGSVAEQVSRRAPCPVATVKEPSPDAQPASELLPGEPS